MACSALRVIRQMLNVMEGRLGAAVRCDDSCGDVRGDLNLYYTWCRVGGRPIGRRSPEKGGFGVMAPDVRAATEPLARHLVRQALATTKEHPSLSRSAAMPTSPITCPPPGAPELVRISVSTRVVNLVVVIVPLLGLAGAMILLWGRGFSWIELGLLF